MSPPPSRITRTTQQAKKGKAKASQTQNKHEQTNLAQTAPHFDLDIQHSDGTIVRKTVSTCITWEAFQEYLPTLGSWEIWFYYLSSDLEPRAFKMQEDLPLLIARAGHYNKTKMLRSACAEDFQK